jgi:hypothetical protein
VLDGPGRSDGPRSSLASGIRFGYRQAWEVLTMATQTARWGKPARSLGLSALAMIVLISPLALWVSWTEWMFVAVVVVGLTAAVLYCLWDRSPEPGKSEPAGRQATRTVSAVDDELLAELSNLNPMVYHNRLSIESRLQATLDRIKQALTRGDR